MQYSTGMLDIADISKAHRHLAPEPSRAGMTHQGPMVMLQAEQRGLLQGLLPKCG